jgi:hypothetical protein
MSTTAEELVPGLTALSDRIARTLGGSVLAKAAALARAGRHTEAEHALEDLKGAESADPVVLDLLARIRAQQGRLAEAETLWSRALKLAPENGGIALALETVRRLQRTRNRPGWVVPAVWLILFVVAFALVWRLQVRQARRQVVQIEELLKQRENLRAASTAPAVAPGIQPLNAADLETALRPLRQTVDELKQGLAGANESVGRLGQAMTEVKSAQVAQVAAAADAFAAAERRQNQLADESVRQRQAVAQQTQAEIRELRDQLATLRADMQAKLTLPADLQERLAAVPGATVERDGNRLAVRFQKGLFWFWTGFKSDAAESLTALAGALRPQAKALRLEVAGAAGHAPLLEDYNTLALSRARKVAALLREQVGLDTGQVAVRAGPAQEIRGAGAQSEGADGADSVVIYLSPRGN